MNIDINSKTQANKFLVFGLVVLFLFGCILTIILKNNESQSTNATTYTNTTTTESVRQFISRDFIQEFKDTLPYKNQDFELSFDSIQNTYFVKSDTLTMDQLVRKVSDYLKYIQNLDRFNISIEFTDKDNNIQNGISRSDITTSETVNNSPTYFDEFVDQ